MHNLRQYKTKRRKCCEWRLHLSLIQITSTIIVKACSINKEWQQFSASYYSDGYNPTNKKYKRHYRVTFSIISIAFVGKVNMTEHETSPRDVIHERNCDLSKFTYEWSEEKNNCNNNPLHIKNILILFWHLYNDFTSIRV